MPDSTKTPALDYPITNAYMFSHVFSEEKNVRPLLEVVLGVPIGEIRFVEPEHMVEPSARGRGVRMDVFVEDGSGAVYDVEMQNADEGDLHLRSRYLLSSFDRDRIERGEKYLQLGKTVVIFVCQFDPIGHGKSMYVVRPMVEGLGEPFDDGTLRVFLNSSGAAGTTACGSRLMAFLSYVDGGGTMGDEWVEGIDEEVRALNGDRSWRNTVLTYEGIVEEKVERESRKAREEGLTEGRAEGRAEGREEERARTLGVVASMVADGLVDLDEASLRFGFPADELAARVAELTGVVSE